MLSPEEVAELVEAYRRGAGQRELAKRYGVHRHTVDRHLERIGVAKRPMVKMTPARVERAKELYGQGLSTNQIGRDLGVSGSTVTKALRRNSDNKSLTRLRSALANNLTSISGLATAAIV